ncbi:MAG: 50S ribosomal protein L9 [Lentisphaerae bacterium]|jgi:large subunit ribosomal protein L9|nr:50S ribosomal protein L9 [Lentisphaerota bacterium]
MGKAIEVVLLEDVTDLGRLGEVCRVRAGYARNFLFPKKLAVAMTPGTRRLIEKKQAEGAVRLAREKEEAEVLLRKLEDLTVECAVKVGAEGRLYGSVSPADVLAQLAAAGHALTKKQLAMYEPFKALGDHEVTLHLHPEVRGTLMVRVVAEAAEKAAATS